MRLLLQRWSVPVLAVTLLAGIPACGGSAIKRDTKRLKNKCNIVRGDPVSEEQARCIGRLFGVKNRKRCPMRVDRPDSFPEPVYRVRENCDGLGIVIAASDGRVLAIVAGDDVLY